MSKYRDPSGGRLGEVNRKYREALMARDEAATRQLAQSYQVVIDGLGRQLALNWAELQARVAQGLEPTVSQLYQQARFAALLQQANASFADLARTTGQVLTAEQRAAVALAEQQVMAALQTQLYGAPDQQAAQVVPGGSLTLGGARLGRPRVTFFTLPTEALEQLQGNLAPGSPLGELLGGFGERAGATAGEVIAAALADGRNPMEARRALAQALGVELGRALTIARTEIWRSYRQATMAAYRENDHLVQRWVWRAHLGTGTCLACLAMHGTVHELDEDFSSHPNCRCVAMPEVVSWAELWKRNGLPGNPPAEQRQPLSSDHPADSWLRGLGEDEQRQILGPRRLELWQAGELQLQDMSRQVNSADWGRSPRVDSISRSLTKARRRA